MSIMNEALQMLGRHILLQVLADLYLQQNAKV